MSSTENEAGAGAGLQKANLCRQPSAPFGHDPAGCGFEVNDRSSKKWKPLYSKPASFGNPSRCGCKPWTNRSDLVNKRSQTSSTIMVRTTRRTREEILSSHKMQRHKYAKHSHVVPTRFLSYAARTGHVPLGDRKVVLASLNNNTNLLTGYALTMIISRMRICSRLKFQTTCLQYNSRLALSEESKQENSEYSKRTEG